MIEVLIAVGIFLGIFLGVPLLFFHGKITHDLTDAKAIKALAASDCPQCAGSIGMEGAIAASVEGERKELGVGVNGGGYWPSIYRLTWHLSCPSCHADLAFDTMRWTVTCVSANTGAKR